MRWLAVESRLAASRLAVLPLTLFTLGRAVSFSYAPSRDRLAGRTLPSVAAPAVYSPANHPRIKYGAGSGPSCVFSHPTSSLAPGIRRGRSASSFNQSHQARPAPRMPGTGQQLKGGVHARQRGPSPLTAGPPGLTTHPHSQGSFPFAGGGPSSLPASGRRPEATQHKRRTDR